MLISAFAGVVGANPSGALALPVLFGFAQATTLGVSLAVVSIDLIEMFPYPLTIIVLAGFGGRAIAPAAIGRPYRKE